MVLERQVPSGDASVVVPRDAVLTSQTKQSVSEAHSDTNSHVINY